MSIKEISEAVENKKILFGIKETLKHKKNLVSVFITKDARDATVNKLESAGIEFSVLKDKKEMAKSLNMDFASEVFAIKK